MVDLAASQLLDPRTLRRFAAKPPVVTNALPPSSRAFSPLWKRPRWFFGRSSASSKMWPTRRAGYCLPSTRRCISSRRRGCPLHLHAAKLVAAKAYFAKLERDRIIRRSSSTWSAPLHIVMKPDGTWQPCNYSRLNLVTTPDTYPLPNIQDLLARLHGCSIFCKLDLGKGYYQIPVQEGDVHKTAVITPFGLWDFLRMMFGLQNARQSFQRFMDEVLAGLDFAFCYLDHIPKASSSNEEHLQHLQLVLQRQRQYRLVLNMKKCELGRQ